MAQVKGTHDLFPEAMPLWHHLESTARDVFERCGYGEIRTPILEEAQLFQRSVGETTDIVSKEMYLLEDRKGRKLALRPEGTASVVRALVQKGLDGGQEIHKYYYLGPMFRYERPQKGRQRQFHQLGVELFGAAEPTADVDLLQALFLYLEALRLPGVALHLNTLGDQRCRPAYRKTLVAFLEGERQALCNDCQERMGTNPLRVLDCKNATCRKIVAAAPNSIDHLCNACRDHFDALRRLLDSSGLPYNVDNQMVRGLDYYQRTVFEFLVDATSGGSDSGLGSQNAVGGGGRFDGLVAELGGKPTPAIGFAMGLERMILLLSRLDLGLKPTAPIHIVHMTDPGAHAAIAIATQLRRAGLTAVFDYRRRSFKAQLGQANREGADTVLILGDDELAAGTITIKNFRQGTQITVAQDKLLDQLKPSAS